MRINVFAWLVVGNGFLAVRAFTQSARPPRQHTLLHAKSIDTCDVAIFGGGFGGLYTALSLSQKSRGRLDIALVEPSESFVFLPLLYDLTVGTATEAEVCPSYNGILRGTGVRQVKASLDEILADSSAKLCPVDNSQAAETMQFRAGVIAVGASPMDILKSVPGALEYAQPFYTARDAERTRRLLNRLQYVQNPKLAVVGGGYGGVELAASVQRRLPSAAVHLLSRGPPMAGTRAEPFIDAALTKLGVNVNSDCTVQALDKTKDNNIALTASSSEGEIIQDEWDAVLWTAGSQPSPPVAGGCDTLVKSPSGRLAVDRSLRCKQDDVSSSQPNIWALGDCAEILDLDQQPFLPKTAQVAMQQAETVTNNVQLSLQGKTSNFESFTYQDLGSMLTLGGPNGAVLAPKEGNFAPLFAPLLDTVDSALQVADNVLSQTVGQSDLAKDLGLTSEIMGLSLGSHGLGADDGEGTLAGTLAGAGRRAVYAVRMPTNQQRAVSFVSAAIATATSLAKEASERNKK